MWEKYSIRTETVYKSSGFSKNNQTVEITEETDVYYGTSYEIKNGKFVLQSPESFHAVPNSSNVQIIPKGSYIIIGGDSKLEIYHARDGNADYPHLKTQMRFRNAQGMSDMAISLQS